MRKPKRQKPLLSRVTLLNEGRACYLDFLRNLGPQTFLLVFLIILASKIDFSRFSLDGLLPTALFYVLLTAFGISAYANGSLLQSRCFSRLLRWRHLTSLLVCKPEIPFWRRLGLRLRAVWAARAVEHLEWLYAVYLVQGAFLAVVVTAAITASGFLGQTYPSLTPVR